jgi:hypothetical protein
VQFPHFGRPINAPGLGNLALSPDGYIWYARGKAVNKVDPNTAQVVGKFLLKKVTSAYGNELSADGRYFAGGSWPEDWVTFLDIESGEIVELQTRTQTTGRISTADRRRVILRMSARQER